MHKWRVFYRDNKLKVWKILGITIFVLAIIYLLNYLLANEKEKQIVDYSKDEQIYTSTESITDGVTLSKESAESNIEIIDEFINYCNSGEIENAYNMLSNDCKEEMFNSLESFREDYYNEIFTEKKSYDVDIWSTSDGVTYKVKIINDIMSTGEVVEKKYIDDYYTIVTEDKQKKLNIDSFINKSEINKEASIDGLKFSAISKKIFMDYEKFEIQIENQLESNVIIDTKENTDTVYLEDKNGVNYGWYGHEIDNKDLHLESGERKTLNITFNKMYNNSRKDNAIYFTNIIIENTGKIEKIKIKL